MTRRPSHPPPSPRPSRWTAPGYCLLIACTLFDASDLATYFDRGPVRTTRATLDDLEEAPDSSGGILGFRVQARPFGRAEREFSPGLAQFADLHTTATREFQPCLLGLNTATRAGCEHGWRNGLGAPLLC